MLTLLTLIIGFAGGVLTGVYFRDKIVDALAKK